MEAKAKTTVHNLIILDESGSMYSIKEQAISSMNETIQTIRRAERENEGQEQFITLISFSGAGMDGVKLIRDKVKASEVMDISEKDYHPDSCTPLYDAMGFGITLLDKTVKKDDIVMVTIITDGMENTSKEYSGASIKKIVETQRTKGWAFAYIGANQDTVLVAKEMNIGNALNFEASKDGTEEMSSRLNMCLARFYTRASRDKSVCNREDFFDAD